MISLPINTPSLRLRHITGEDAARMMELNGEPSTRRWLPSHVYANAQEAVERMNYLMACYASPGDPRLGPYVLAVDHIASGTLLGHVGFSPLDGDVESPTPSPRTTAIVGTAPRLCTAHASGLHAASVCRVSWPSPSPRTCLHAGLWTAHGLFTAKTRSCGFRVPSKRSVITCGAPAPAMRTSGRQNSYIADRDVWRQG